MWHYTLSHKTKINRVKYISYVFILYLQGKKINRIHLLHGVQQRVFVQSVQDWRQLLRVPFASGPRVPVCRQVKHPEAIEYHSHHHPFECIFNSLFCLIPSTTYLDRRLFVEHAQLVSWNVRFPSVYLSLLLHF